MREPNGFARFVGEQQSGLLRLTRAITGNEQLAEDLAQAALERLWRHWDRVVIRDDANPAAYLHRIVVTLHATWWRRRWRGEVAAGALPDVAAVDGAHDRIENADAIAGWLRALPARQRAVIVLRFLADRSVTETAEILGCSEGTIKSQTSKALSQLRAGMTKEGKARHE